MKTRAALWRKLAWSVALLTLLGLVFCLYWRPDMAFDVATRLWSCI
jgi:hypothetical protein